MDLQVSVGQSQGDNGISRALVIDDDQSISQLLALFLETMGVEAQTTDHLPDKEMVERYEVIFTDLHMPNTNPQDVADHFEKMHCTQPVVAVSGTDSAAIPSLFTTFLPKPFDEEKIKKVLEELGRVTIG